MTDEEITNQLFEKLDLNKNMKEWIEHLWVVERFGGFIPLELTSEALWWDNFSKQLFPDVKTLKLDGGKKGG